MNAGAIWEDQCGADEDPRGAARLVAMALLAVTFGTGLGAGLMLAWFL